MKKLLLALAGLLYFSYCNPYKPANLEIGKIFTGEYPFVSWAGGVRNMNIEDGTIEFYVVVRNNSDIDGAYIDLPDPAAKVLIFMGYPITKSNYYKSFTNKLSLSIKVIENEMLEYQGIDTLRAGQTAYAYIKTDALHREGSIYYSLAVSMEK